MLELQLHWTEILLVALTRNILGLAWYSPLMFGPTWARHLGCTQMAMRKRLLRVFPLEFACSCVIAFVLAQVLNFAGAIDWVMGMVVGFLMWAGFIAATTPNQMLYARRPAAVYLIDNGFCLVSLLGMGVLMATWKWDSALHAALDGALHSALAGVAK
jgi:hypothetical protein